MRGRQVPGAPHLQKTGLGKPTCTFDHVLIFALQSLTQFLQGSPTRSQSHKSILFYLKTAIIMRIGNLAITKKVALSIT